MRKRKWLNLILILNVLLILMVFLVGGALVLGKYPFLAGADYSLRAVGYSMLPVERTGDMVLVKKGTGDIQVGDVICFWSDRYSELIGHRVTDIQIYPNTMFKTKGDANKFSDGWILASSVVGKETLTIPFGFFIARNAICFLIGIGLITLLLTLLFYSLKAHY